MVSMPMPKTEMNKPSSHQLDEDVLRCSHLVMKRSRSDFMTGARLAYALIHSPHLSSSISALKFFPHTDVHSPWLALHPAAVPSARSSYSYTKLLSYVPTMDVLHVASGDEPAPSSCQRMSKPVDASH